MGRLNSGDWKIVFGTNLRTLRIGLVKSGRASWQEHEQFFTSELFKVIQDAILLILHCKRQTVFFTSVDPMNKEHTDPNNMDLEAPRLAWNKQKSGEDTRIRCILST